MNQIAKRPEGAVAMPNDLKGSWGSEGVDKKDILIPKLLLMQGLSKAVAADKAVQGEIIKSTTQKVVAKKGEQLEFIPLSTFKTWALSEKVGPKFEYRGEVPLNADNSDAALEWQDEKTKNEWRRDRTLNFIVLLPSEVAKEKAAFEAIKAGKMVDPDDALLPYGLSFRRTGYSAGKTLITHFAKSEHFGMPPACKVFTLSSRLEKNDLGSFHVLEVLPSRMATPEELVFSRKWYDTLGSSKVKIDDDSDDPTVAPSRGEPVAGKETF